MYNTFKLVKDGNVVKLVATDDVGRRVRANIIFTFTSDGKVHRCTGINRDVDLELDGDGRVQLVED